jgi:hypothetical protein
VLKRPAALRPLAGGELFPPPGNVLALHSRLTGDSKEELFMRVCVSRLLTQQRELVY